MPRTAPFRIPRRVPKHDSPVAVSVDVGTHSVRALTASYRNDGSYELLEDIRIPTGLGAGLRISGQISATGQHNLEKAMDLLFQSIRGRNVATMTLVATSALRTASNGPEILEGIRKRFGLPATIITGEQEADLVFRSARDALGLSSSDFTLLDIGAGSVEIAIHSSVSKKCAVSLDIGARYLTDLFRTHNPLSSSDWCRMSDYIRSTLSATPLGRCRFPRRGVGTGGTYTTLASVHRFESGRNIPLHGYVLETRDIERLALNLAFSSQEQLRATRGISPDRAGIVPAGMCLVFQLLRHLALDSITVCDRGLREGVLMDLIERKTGHRPTSHH